MKREAPDKPGASPFRRGDIWWLDFGDPVGREMAKMHPAVIVSKQEFNNAAPHFGWLIVVPGTSTRHEVPRTNRILMTHLEVTNTALNGLKNKTYFQCEQVRMVGTERMQRHLGTMEAKLLRDLEERLCLVMDLCKR